jgi:iron(III) transport system substrate-binding protein
MVRRLQMHWKLVTLLALFLLVLAACGPPEEGGADDDAPAADAGDGDDAADGDAADGEDLSTYEGVLAHVDGMDMEERTETLRGLAEEEGDVVRWHVSAVADLAEALQAAFEDEYDITVEMFRGARDDVHRRIIEEDAADYQDSAGVLELTGPQIADLAAEGYLVEYDSPARDGLLEEARYDTWSAFRLTLMVTSWNTDLVDDPPGRWTELADFDGQLSIDSEYVAWYQAAWQYLVDEEGMSPEEADSLFEDIVGGSLAIRPPSTALNLMGAGDFDMILHGPSHSADNFIEDGAPISYEPIVEPAIIEPNGVALVRNSDHPATAILFMDWLLTDGQEIVADAGVPSPRADIFEQQGLDQYEILTADVEALVPEYDEWQQRWENLVRLAEEVDT